MGEYWVTDQTRSQLSSDYRSSNVSSIVSYMHATGIPTGQTNIFLPL